LASLVEHWKNDRGIQEPRNVLLLASLNAEVREVNRMCQRERFVAGVLGTEKLFVDGDHLHVGDRVRLGLGKDALRHGIKNGFTGEVVSVNPETRMLSIRLDKGDRLVTLSVEHFGAQHIRLGYARTVHGSQGKTVRACHVLMGGHMDDLHLGYVQSSRSTDSTSLIVDQAHAGPQLKDIVRSLSRDRTKDLARDILDRTHELSQERTQKPRQQHHHGHSHRL
jgi:ATP-dependent exoDNAse (exonuclease V) alpha subunit